MVSDVGRGFVASCGWPGAIAVALVVGFTGASGAAAAEPADAEALDARVRRAYERGVLWGLRRAPEISVTEVLELEARDALLLVDARTDEERAVSVVPGSVPLAELDSELRDRPDATVVVYCTVGARSAGVTRTLRARGVEAWNLVGGVLAWAHAGRVFIHDGLPTRRVHVYGRSWNLLPDGYDAVW